MKKYMVVMVIAAAVIIFFVFYLLSYFLYGFDTVRGVMLYNRGSFHTAKIVLKDAIRKNPKDFKAYVYLARSYIATGSNADGIDICRNAIKIDPRNPDMYVGMAVAFYNRDERDKAIQYLQDAIDRRPHYEDRLKDILTFLRKNTLFISAQRDVRKTLDAYEKNPSPKIDDIVLQAHRYFVIGNNDQAVKLCTTVLEINPLNFNAHLCLLYVYLVQEEYDNALHHMCSLLTHHYETVGNSVLWREWKALFEFKKSRSLEAIKKDIIKADAYVKITPRDLSLHLRLIRGHFRIGELEKAKDYCTRALLIDPGKKEVYMYLGIIERTLQNYSEAIRAFKRVLEIDPDDSDARKSLEQAESLQRYGLNALEIDQINDLRDIFLGE